MCYDFNIIGNSFNGNFSGGDAIDLFSSNGKIRNNIIHGYRNGILLGNSFIELGNNEVKLNSSSGIYIGDGSFVDMKGRMFIKPDCPGNLIYYPVTGYNKISNNGTTWDDLTSSEIAFEEGNILLDDGNNIIEDNRSPVSYETKNLLFGNLLNEQQLLARHNDWGTEVYYPTYERFGDLDVVYEPTGIYYPDVPVVNCGHINVTSDGTIIDTIPALGLGPEEYEYLDGLYAIGLNKIDEQDYDGASVAFKNLINIYFNDPKAEKAYSLLFDILVMKNAVNQEYLDLQYY